MTAAPDTYSPWPSDSEPSAGCVERSRGLAGREHPDPAVFGYQVGSPKHYAALHGHGPVKAPPDVEYRVRDFHSGRELGVNRATRLFTIRIDYDGVEHRLTVRATSLAEALDKCVKALRA